MLFFRRTCTFRVVTYEENDIWVALAVDLDKFGYGANESAALSQLSELLKPLVPRGQCQVKRKRAPEKWKDLGTLQHLEVRGTVEFPRLMRWLSRGFWQRTLKARP